MIEVCKTEQLVVSKLHRVTVLYRIQNLISVRNFDDYDN